MVLILSACQQKQHPKIQQFAQNWNVIESVGEVRIERGHSPYATNLRPGDQIAEESHIRTGRSSHLILSQGDVQLTASGDNSITLPKSVALYALSHNHGSVRVRLAAAANATRLITTPHLTANGTDAVLELRVDDKQSLITVSSGSVVLSTPDGDHHAQLAAGASARLGADTNGQLEIRQAAGMPFRPSRTLLGVPSKAEPAEPDDGKDSLAALPVGTELDHQVAVSTDVAIIPAGFPKPKAPEQESPSTDKVDGGQLLTDRPTDPEGPAEPFVKGNDTIPASTSLQGQFDDLTEGLLLNLPTAKSQTHQEL